MALCRLEVNETIIFVKRRWSGGLWGHASEALA
jgi:hypothetical protein